MFPYCTCARPPKAHLALPLIHKFGSQRSLISGGQTASGLHFPTPLGLASGCSNSHLFSSSSFLSPSLPPFLYSASISLPSFQYPSFTHLVTCGPPSMCQALCWALATCWRIENHPCPPGVHSQRDNSIYNPLKLQRQGWSVLPWELVRKAPQRC